MLQSERVFQLGVSEYQTGHPPGGTGSTEAAAPPPAGQLSDALSAEGWSDAAGLQLPECLMASRGASLCSMIGDETGTEEEEELSRQILEEFSSLSCSASGGGGGGQHAGRSSRRSSLQCSRKASAAVSLPADGDASDAGAAAEDAAAAANDEEARGDAAEGFEDEGWEEEEEPLPSLYDQVGGGVAVKQLVDDFYREVLEDPQLAVFFAGVDMSRHVRKFLLFVTYVLGGPDEYLQLHPEPWPQLYHVHERLITNLGLTELHFDLIKEHFRDALVKQGVGEVQVGQALNIVESTRQVMFPRHRPAPLREQQADEQHQKAAEQQQHQGQQKQVAEQQQEQLRCPYESGAAEGGVAQQCPYSHQA